MASNRLCAHDYPRLVKRWKAISRRAGLKLQPFAVSGGYDIFYAAPRHSRDGLPALYASAGIHGDEAASVEGLAEWAENSIDFLRGWPVMLMPCLNPWGLVHNSRRDASGRDLNRRYHTRSVPQIAAHRRILRGQHFSLAMTLHEDYDAHGIYLYEIRGSSSLIGDRILSAAAAHLPIEIRRSIEGSRSKNGLLRRKITPESMSEHPEAFLLHFQHADRTITLETPSEFSITDRTLAHVAGMQAAAAFVMETSSYAQP